MKKQINKIKIAYTHKPLIAQQEKAPVFVSCLVMEMVAVSLTCLNIVKGYMLMANGTATLAIGLTVCMILYKRFENEHVVPIAICVLIAFMFSFFGLIGGNNGFAILWILLVPAAAMELFGLRKGTVLTVYFQLFLIALFYTPLFRTPEVYSDTFCQRFPILYFTDAALAIILLAQKEYSSVLIDEKTYRDALSGLFNRMYYNAILEKYKRNPSENVSVFLMDLNRLKYVNDNYGHAAGDELVCEAAKCIRKAFSEGTNFRIGGDEFLTIYFDEIINIDEKINNLKKYEKEFGKSHKYELNISIGTAEAKKDKNNDIEKLMLIADKRMYKEKSLYYQHKKIERRQ